MGSEMCIRDSTHTQKVHELDAEVGSAISNMGDRAASVGKQVIDTMLAAVAAVLGSFIGAAFGTAFNEDIFVVGMYVYAGYVLVFPGAFGLWNHHVQYRQARRHYEIRRDRFKLVLGEPRVEEIEANRITSAVRHYWVTFVVGIIAYLAVSAGAIVAAHLVPDYVTNDGAVTEADRGDEEAEPVTTDDRLETPVGDG